MSGSKAALKAISAAIKAQKYDDAIQEAQKLLAADPKSYQAYVLSLRRPVYNCGLGKARDRDPANSLQDLSSWASPPASKIKMQRPKRPTNPPRILNLPILKHGKD